MRKTAQEIMSKHLITVGIHETVKDAYSVMQKNRIRHLPVTDDAGTLVGILSDRDVQRCIRFEVDNRAAVLDVELSLDPAIKVADAMSWPLHKVAGSVPVKDVALRMLNEKISSILVECPETGRRGILTTDDLLRLLISLLEKDPSRLRLAVDSILEDYTPIAVS